MQYIKTKKLKNLASQSCVCGEPHITLTQLSINPLVFSTNFLEVSIYKNPITIMLLVTSTLFCCQINRKSTYK